MFMFTQSCFEQDVYVYPSSSISGRVINERGLGVDGEVELIPVNLRKTDKGVAGPWEIAKHEDGSFELPHVAPGDYLLVYNRDNSMDPDEPYAATYFGGGHDALGNRLRTPISTFQIRLQRVT
jgi:hypothetical protein